MASHAPRRLQFAHAIVVGGIEFSERVRLAARAHTAQKGAHQPVAIDGTLKSVIRNAVAGAEE